MEVYTIPKKWLIWTQINKTVTPNLYWIKKDFIIKLILSKSIQLFKSNSTRQFHDTIIHILTNIYELHGGVHNSKEVADTDANKQNFKTESILN